MLDNDLTDGILTLTLNRPERKNALTQGLLRHLREALQNAAVDPAVRVVVVTGAGDIFSAGGDLDGMHAIDPDDTVAIASSRLPGWDAPSARADRIARNAEISRLLQEMPKPTIARIRGPAVGAALSIALACDLRYIDPSARFITAFTRIGLAGDLGITPLLLNLVGPAKTKELMFFSPILTAPEIMALGLANVLVDAGQLDARVNDDAKTLADGPTLAWRSVKSSLAVAMTSSLQQAMRAEADNQAHCLYSDDAREAGRAFLEKRPARFTGG